MKVRITITKPSNEEKKLWYDTPTEITIGRSQNCTCCIDDDPMISRMHAVLLVDPPAVRLKDLNSTNGVMINGELYGGMGNEKLLQATQLRDGDELMIGNTLLRVSLVEDVDAPETAPEPETVIRPTGTGPVQDARPHSRSTSSPLESAQPRVDINGAGLFGRSPVDLNLLAPAIPGYEISTFIGSGRTGSVYRALNLDTGQEVAIKVMFPELSFTRKMADSFRHGVDSLKSVAVPSMVKYLASGDVRVNSVYLATEYVPGPSLAARLDQAPNRILPLEQACIIFGHLCVGLNEALKHGLMHLDLRPSKILFEKETDNAGKIADIGMATIFSDAGLSVAGANIGEKNNLAYSAPELVQSAREPRPTADVFGAAALLYEMLTGVGPYNFTSADDATMVVARGDIIPLQQRRNDIPEPVATLIERCLLPDPDYRYQNCGDVAEALAAL